MYIVFDSESDNESEYRQIHDDFRNLVSLSCIAILLIGLLIDVMTKSRWI